ncbi:MAG: hypothetical protein ACOX88_06815, partial [Christensenellales bacterium]
MNNSNVNREAFDNFDPEDTARNKLCGGFAYLLFFMPLIISPHSAYARFHANQSLVLLIFTAVGAVFLSFLTGVSLLVPGLFIPFSIVSGIYCAFVVTCGV